MAEEPTAGTPGAPEDDAINDGGTPAASTDGSGEVSVDAGELEKLRNIREQFLREKDNTERTNRENEMLRQHVDQLGRAYQPPTGIDPRMQRLAQIHQTVQERDPDTLELISEYARATQEQIQRQQAEQRYYRELGAVSTEDRTEVERIAKSDNLWPSIARDRLLARRYEKERTEIADQRRKLQEDHERKARGVVKTTAEPAPAASNRNEPTQEDYAHTARLAGAGNTEALKKMREWDRREETEGPIKFRSG